VTDVASIVAGTAAQTPAQQAQQPAPAQPEPPAKRKFSEVLDQADERQFPDLPPEQLAELRAEHVAVTGGPPMEDARPSSDQLAALAARLKAKQAPYVDFAVFGPFGRRTAKLMRFTAQVWVNGSLQTRQLRGPDSFEQWRSAWKVYRASMIMLGAVRPSSLDSYEEGIRQLVAMFPQGWGTIATADEVQRSERWEVALEQNAMNPSAGFDSTCPWDTIIRESAFGGCRNHWWETRVLYPLLRGSSGRQAADTTSRLDGVLCGTSLWSSQRDTATTSTQPAARQQVTQPETQTVASQSFRGRPQDRGCFQHWRGRSRRSAGQAVLPCLESRQLPRSLPERAPTCLSELRRQAPFFRLSFPSGEGKG